MISVKNNGSDLKNMELNLDLTLEILGKSLNLSDPLYQCIIWN